MSLILDALNRSQKERDTGREVPGIDTEHWIEPLPRSGGWQRSLPWLALAIALATIAWLLLDGTDSNVVPVSQPSPRAEHTPKQVPQGEAAGNTQRSAGAPGPQENSLTPTKAATPASAGHSARTAFSNAAKSTAPQASGTTTAVADLYKNKEPIGSQQHKERPDPVHSATTPSVKQRQTPQGKTRSAHSDEIIDIEKMITMARGQVDNQALPEHPAPFLSDLSQQTKDQIPTIYYTRHEFSEFAEQSSVTLNGNVVHVGGTVAGKLKLVEILPKSIVLSDRGQEFRLKALNSWINL